MSVPDWIALNGLLLRVDAIEAIGRIEGGSFIVCMKSGREFKATGVLDELTATRNQIIRTITGEELPS